MTARRPPPAGTKHEILNLLVRQELSSKSLAEHLQVSPAAVRQHLDTLEALGLVTRRKLVTRPSRPTFLYRLTPQGRRVFPKRYDLLLGQVIEVLAERHGAAAVAGVVEAAAARLAARVRDRFQQGDRRARWNLLLGWLEEELAWQADVTEEPGGGRRITIHHCPFQEVAAAHPAVCAGFLTTLIRALGGDARVEHTPAAGQACCTLVVGGR
jgi:predicted ArsR family transcriptional regulator